MTGSEHLAVSSGSNWDADWNTFQSDRDDVCQVHFRPGHVSFGATRENRNAATSSMGMALRAAHGAPGTTRVAAYPQRGGLATVGSPGALRMLRKTSEPGAGSRSGSRRGNASTRRKFSRRPGKIRNAATSMIRKGQRVASSPPLPRNATATSLHRPPAAAPRRCGPCTPGRPFSSRDRQFSR